MTFEKIYYYCSRQHGNFQSITFVHLGPKILVVK